MLYNNTQHCATITHLQDPVTTTSAPVCAHKIKVRVTAGQHLFCELAKIQNETVDCYLVKALQTSRFHV